MTILSGKLVNFLLQTTDNLIHTATIHTLSHSVIASFATIHGLAIRAIAVEVKDTVVAFNASVANGAKPSSPPVELDGGAAVIAEVQLYDDEVLRCVSHKTPDPIFLPRFEKVEGSSSFPLLDYEICLLDHAVGNVIDLAKAVAYVKEFTGFYEFAEFTTEDVGTSESGLNSVVLANNDEMVLLPMNETVFGTKRKSQIQTYLEYNDGPGVQHLALMSEDIFRTLRDMGKRSGVGGFDFMPSLLPTYYRNLKNRANDILSDEHSYENPLWSCA